MATSPAPPPGTQTLARGIAVVDAVARGRTRLRDIAEQTGVGRSTTHRLLQLLRTTGYLRRLDDGAYALGPALIQLGYQALQENPVTAVAAPVLRALAERVRDTVHLAIEDRGQVLYLEKIPGTRGAVMRSQIGHRMPLTRTGIGKALLLDSPDRWRDQFLAERPAAADDGLDRDVLTTDAFVEVMRASAARGVAFDLEENEPGILCVAAPVRDASGGIVAAVSVTATRPFMPPERLEALVPVVREAAGRVSAGLGAPTGT
ncbi:IclR family transcriptional regulator [Promicromonospora thailandica]|uniref:Transcriptional regulator, IclR family n=1 Tax=Promicromonospora thailandica TaxID=765201 RepID=A0A9X2JV98_9MICO|nr:IclR family transcriptional regulator [Promicromonospora thailandica]MCP2264856.1 transcriptional regulator, IclR family [Promicromonospora thailandica]BFF18886.1 IclR family transcriptional regulator [Promicromonospora thailandica]